MRSWSASDQAPAAAEKNLAVRRIFHRIGEQIADHLFKQARIAPNIEPARHSPALETLGRRVIGEFRSQIAEKLVDRKDDDFGTNDSCFELVDVE